MIPKPLPSLRIVFLAVALLAGAATAHAQDWTKLGTLPFNVRCGYFWDFYHGVVAGEYGIYWYNNGVWTASKHPNGNGVFRSMRMLSPGHLYTCGAPQFLLSNDSGKSWDTTGPPQSMRLPPTCILPATANFTEST